MLMMIRLEQTGESCAMMRCAGLVLVIVELYSNNWPVFVRGAHTSDFTLPEQIIVGRPSTDDGLPNDTSHHQQTTLSTTLSSREDFDSEDERRQRQPAIGDQSIADFLAANHHQATQNSIASNDTFLDRPNIEDVSCNGDTFEATVVLPKSFVIAPEFNDLRAGQDEMDRSSVCTIKQVKYRLYPTYRIYVSDFRRCGVTEVIKPTPSDSRGDIAPNKSSSYVDGRRRHSNIRDFFSKNKSNSAFVKDQTNTGNSFSKTSSYLLNIRFPVIKSLRTEEDTYATLVCSREKEEDDDTSSPSIEEVDPDYSVAVPAPKLDSGESQRDKSPSMDSIASITTIDPLTKNDEYNEDNNNNNNLRDEPVAVEESRRRQTFSAVPLFKSVSANVTREHAQYNKTITTEATIRLNNDNNISTTLEPPIMTHIKETKSDIAPLETTISLANGSTIRTSRLAPRLRALKLNSTKLRPPVASGDRYESTDSTTIATSAKPKHKQHQGSLLFDVNLTRTDRILNRGANDFSLFLLAFISSILMIVLIFAIIVEQNLS